MQEEIRKCKIASCGEIVEVRVVKQLKRKKTNMKRSKILREKQKIRSWKLSNTEDYPLSKSNGD